MLWGPVRNLRNSPGTTHSHRFYDYGTEENPGFRAPSEKHEKPGSAQTTKGDYGSNHKRGIQNKGVPENVDYSSVPVKAKGGPQISREREQMHRVVLVRDSHKVDGGCSDESV